MQLLNVSGAGLPIYLPADTAQVPFGDPLAATITSAAPAVVTVPGYTPAVNDLVQFSNTGGALPTGIVAGTTYYVVSPSGQTLEVSATKGGSAINTTVSAGTGQLYVHLISAQVYGTTLPFKPGYTALAENNTTGSITLFGAPDTNTTSYGNPVGPQAFNVIATIGSGQQQLVQLGYDWIKASAAIAGGVLSLQQN